MTAPVSLNGRSYQPPKAPVVVVCVDGCEPDYINLAIGAGAAPWFAGLADRGTCLTADCVVPSFTNPNNMSIVTGAPPSVHGICGNYFWDRDAQAEVMMNDPRFLRSGTLLAAFADAGASVAVITAKDKLRAMLGHKLTGICFSSEKADKVSRRRQRHRRRDGADRDAAAVGLQRGALRVRVRRGRRAARAPASGPHVPVDDRLRAAQARAGDGRAPTRSSGMMDSYLGRLDKLGATVVVTADHGMNAKTDAFGRPNIVFLQDLADHWYGPGCARVILPITDPYVRPPWRARQLRDDLPAPDHVGDAEVRLRSVPGVWQVLGRDEACRRYELPADRVGDIVVIAERLWTLGTSKGRHDLSGLDAPLRSHGGVSEQQVPLIANRPPSKPLPDRRWRNFDAFRPRAQSPGCVT
jgi:phosphonoacetate hydrolase